MNKYLKSIIAFLAGFDTVFYVVTPVLVGILWSSVVGFEDWRTTLIYVTGALATLFRGIKIGFRI